MRTWPSTARLVLGSRMGGHDRPRMNRLRDYADASDAMLLSWSASGDGRAFDQMVIRYGPFALRIALRLLPDPPVAEDVAQEAMMRAWSQVRHFDPRRASFNTWLYRIVVNLCIDHRRRVQPEPIPDDFDPADPAAGADENMEITERRVALRMALKDLPVRQRAAMTLVYQEGMSGAEAARVLGLSAKAVERFLARARTCLRERLLPEHDFMETWKC